MEQPQEFLYHKEHISDEFKPNSDVESAVTKGIYFVHDITILYSTLTLTVYNNILQ